MTSKHFLQSEYWEKVRVTQGHKAVRVAGSLMLIKPLKFPFKSFGYMPQALLKDMDWDALMQSGRENNLSHIQIDPADLREDYSIPSHVRQKYIIKRAAEVYYRDTLVIDLTLSEQQLLEQMHKKHRYNIKVAQKSGVVVEIRDDAEAFSIFLNLFFDTVSRQKYFGRDRQYYSHIWQVLQPLGKAKIALATVEGQPAVAWMIFLDQNTIYYPYGGSSYEHRNKMPANGLVWHLINWGKEQGYTYLDLWGIDPEGASRGKNEHGFSRFKEGFGGIKLHYSDSIDVVISVPHYWLFKLANGIRWVLLKISNLF